MSTKYNPVHSDSTITTPIDRIMHRVDIDPDDVSLLAYDTDYEHPDVTDGEDQEVNEGYNPAIGDFSATNSEENDHDTTKLKKTDPDDISMLDGKNADAETGLLDEPDEEDTAKDQADYVPSSIVDYYNETALKAKTRNALDDSQFGLPRLRAYPLNDASHVKQAIRMFGHCKDPEDQKVLARNIFKAVKKFGITVKIGKNNALYEYAPESLKEDAEPPLMMIAGFEKPMKERTKEDVVKEHLRYNAARYNTIFYGPDFAQSVKAMEDFDFMNCFYPDVKRLPFIARLHSVLGGLVTPGDDQNALYDMLGIRAPCCTDMKKPLGWLDMEKDEETIVTLQGLGYSSECNWFKIDLSGDVDHTMFCLRLYSIMGEIFLDPNFSQHISLEPRHLGILTDWGQRVSCHYDMMLEAEPDSNDQYRQMQYLWDLYWNCLDNPYDQDVITHNIIGMLRAMPSVKNIAVSVNEANDSGELITKEKCSAYLVHDLGMGDDLYLLPATMEFPIVDQTSVKLAMDMINDVPKDDVEEYVRNLNRKYKEMGCTFSISADHPYAKYADKNIVNHMSMILSEGEDNTAVDNDEPADTSGKEGAPFYKSHTYNWAVERNLADDKELGPNTKKAPQPDYAFEVDSVY